MKQALIFDRTAIQRFKAKYSVNQATGCWDWSASKNLGYGQMGINLGDGKYRPLFAHRISYEIHKGDIPENLVIDHICRNRGCVNPDHLRLLTRGENVMCGDTITARKSNSALCPNGHVYEEESIYRYKGWRICKICRRKNDAKRKQRNKTQDAAIYETSPDF